MNTTYPPGTLAALAAPVRGDLTAPAGAVVKVLSYAAGLVEVETFVRVSLTVDAGNLRPLGDDGDAGARYGGTS